MEDLADIVLKLDSLKEDYAKYLFDMGMPQFAAALLDGSDVDVIHDKAVSDLMTQFSLTKEDAVRCIAVGGLYGSIAVSIQNVAVMALAPELDLEDEN